MFVTESPAKLLRHQTARFRRVGVARETVRAELVRGGVRDHAELTSGAVSSRTLAAWGHPFGRKTPGDFGAGVRGAAGKTSKDLSARARRRGARVRKGVLSPLPINRQSGRLRRSFFHTVSGPSDDMGFSADHARWVLSRDGTRRMTARGFYSSSPTGMGGYVGPLRRRWRARLAAALRVVREAENT